MRRRVHSLGIDGVGGGAVVLKQFCRKVDAGVHLLVWKLKRIHRSSSMQISDCCLIIRKVLKIFFDAGPRPLLNLTFGTII